MSVLDETRATAIVGQLSILLDKQIASAEKGQYGQVESLARETASLIREVTQVKGFDVESCSDWQKTIRQKYKRLELILAAAKEMAKGELKQVQTTRKMLSVYRSSNR